MLFLTVIKTYKLQHQRLCLNHIFKRRVLEETSLTGMEYHTRLLLGLVFVYI